MNDDTEDYTYLTGTNRLDQIAGANPISITYDANGNTTAIGTKTLIYNQNNRLIRVEENSLVLGEYTYNGLGQRVIKTVDGATTVFHYDHTGKLIAESLPDGTITAEYLYMGKISIAHVDVSTGRIYYYLNDRLGTSQLMTNDTGTIVWEASYRPFGEATINLSSNVTNNFRFPGQYYDEEAGLHYNYFRYYDPRTGRYLTPDPIVLRGGINMYVYCMNDPVNLVDPSGQFGIPGIIIGAASGAFAGFVAGAQAGNIWAGVVGGTIGGLAGGALGFAYAPGGSVVGSLIGGAIAGVFGGATGGAVGKRMKDPDATLKEIGFATAKGAGIGLVTGTLAGAVGAAGLSIEATGYALNLAGAVIATPITCVLGVITFRSDFDREGDFGSTIPHYYEYSPDWLPTPDIYTSSDTVAGNNYVDVWVDSGGSGCPSYSWLVSGKGFHFGNASGPTMATTNADLDKLQLWADDSACGSTTITVTDACGQRVTEYVRCTNGIWVEKMAGACVLYGAGAQTWYQEPARYGYELIEGDRKQTQTTIWAGGCSEPWPECPLPSHYWCPNGFCQQQSETWCGSGDTSNCIDPDHGFPYECGWARGYCGCSCYCATQKVYYEWECP